MLTGEQKPMLNHLKQLLSSPAVAGTPTPLNSLARAIQHDSMGVPALATSSAAAMLAGGCAQVQQGGASSNLGSNRSQATRSSSSDAFEAGSLAARLAKLLSKIFRPLVRWEKRAQTHLRKLTAAGRLAFAAAMIATHAFAVVIPLIATQSRSFEEANRICYLRFADRWQEMGAIMGTKSVNTAPWDREYEFGKIPEGWHAHLVLLPGHYFNCASAFVSLAGALYWLFLAPHQHSRNEVVLDRKQMTFFLGQFACGVTVILCSLCFCAPNMASYQLLFATYNSAFFGGSILATNFFSVRYLFEKARIITRRSPPGVFFWSMRRLGGLFNAMVGVSLAIVPGGCVIMLLSGFMPVAMDILMALLACYSVCLIVVDGLFSIGLHTVFLYPIELALGRGEDSRLKKLRKIRMLTLIGASLCVVSSSGLYLDLLVAFVSATGLLNEAAYLNSPWRDPQIFSGNLDNALNVVGMVLVSAAVSTAISTKVVPAASHLQQQGEQIRRKDRKKGGSFSTFHDY